MRFVFVPALIIVLAALGCSNKESAPAGPAGPRVAGAAALQLEGPGGSVAVGASLDDVKRAFPMPEGGHPKPYPTFKNAGLESWGWYSKEGTSAFEAGMRMGRVEALVYATPPESPAKTKAAIQSLTSQLGKPTSSAEGKTVSMYVWVTEKHARVTMANMSSTDSAVTTVIASRQVFEKLSIPIDDPASFIKQFEIGTDSVTARPPKAKPADKPKKK